jgi:2-oxoglutarate ferredoxin oxidoreductase subunit beta
MPDLNVLKPTHFASDQDVRWCPGCGDYAILAQMRKVLAKRNASRENTVFVAGIGCSSRFPYYMATYGFHSIHGRAPGFATGVKLANPALDVWQVTGDGDGLSIGGNHLMHALRRNIGIKILLFNNQIYGLTKGQYSPTSEPGKKTPSTPMGSIETPLNPVSIAVAAEASFVARAVDVDLSLPACLDRAAEHDGAAFLEIYQDCNVFNHQAFLHATDKDSKEDHLLRLEHGKPMLFGKAKDKGVRIIGTTPEVVAVGQDGVTVDDLCFHDEADHDLAFILSRMRHPEMPEPVGVIHCKPRPSYESQVDAQVAAAIEKRGRGTIRSMLEGGATYDVAPGDQGTPTHGLHE